MPGRPDHYRHTQHAPICLFVYATALVFLVISWMMRSEASFATLSSVIGALLLLTGASFHNLTVADDGDRLSVRFGPLPIFGTSIRFDDMRSVKVGKTTWLDGWGIHLSYRGGWVWNIWGWDCVVVKLVRGTIRIGSDDAPNLARYLQDRLRQR